MRKNVIVDVIEEYNILNENNIKINKERSGEYYFEISNKATNDLSESISMMMSIKNTTIWNMDLPNIDFYNIRPEKCLYWISGGDAEWVGGDHYVKSWNDCYSAFLTEFGETVIYILEHSKTFGDVRNGFKKYLNLSVLYEFALENELVV